MRSVALPGTDREVSKACLGTMTFGGQVDTATARALVRYALDSGINFIDTANIYNDTASETMLGEILKGVPRSSYVLASKVGAPYARSPRSLGLSPSYIRDELEGSLRRLKTDYLDIYYMHICDPHTSVEATMATMDSLVRAGKVRYIGVSNHAAWQVTERIEHARAKDLARPVVSQVVYNLLTRGIESEFLACAERYALGITVYNPLAGGLLSGKYTIAETGDNTRFALSEAYRDRYWSDVNFRAVKRFEAVAREAGMTLTELALRFLVSSRAIHSVILGVTRLEHLEKNIAAIDSGSLPSDILGEINAIYRDMFGRFSYCDRSAHLEPGSKG